jgi:dUTP pyrophosphatase
MISIGVQRLPHGLDLALPEKGSEGSAGFDLRAAIDESLSVEPGERALVPTALVLEIPAGWEGQVRPRSGLALRFGVTLVNTPGTIDSDYRGEVKVLLINLGAEPFTVERGDRIAQVVFAPVASVRLEVVEQVDESGRGSGGFGSTGVG